MKYLVLFLGIILAMPALAQQADVNERTVQMLGSQAATLILQVNRLQDQIATLQDQLSKSHAEVKRLKDKYEPVEKPNAQQKP